MREIKFRAWDIARNKMHYDWCKIDTHISASEDKHEFYSVSYKEYSAPQNHVIAVMQYTGLKDKNGKEIYEGDIVIVQDFHDLMPAEVRWRETGEWEYLPKDWRIGYSAPMCGVLVEIIGNIYENPELLKGVSSGTPVEG